MSVIELPTWRECEERVIAEKASALEKFIYNNEPAGRGSKGQSLGDEWREALAKTILECECVVRVPEEK